MHMKVLRTRRAVRGIHMKIGQKKRDVIVNVAPVIVDGILKGSVGVIRSMSEIQKLTNELNRARQIIRTLKQNIHLMILSGIQMKQRQLSNGQSWSKYASNSAVTR